MREIRIHRGREMWWQGNIGSVTAALRATAINTATAPSFQTPGELHSQMTWATAHGPSTARPSMQALTQHMGSGLACQIGLAQSQMQCTALTLAYWMGPVYIVEPSDLRPVTYLYSKLRCMSSWGLPKNRMLYSTPCEM